MAEIAAPSFKRRSNKSANIRKRAATPLEKSGSESEYSEDDAGTKVKRRRKEGLAVGGKRSRAVQDFSKATRYEADRSTALTSTDEATKTSNWYAEAANAAEAAKTTARARAEQKGDAAMDGSYTGAANYSSFIQKHPDAASRQVGPVRAPTNVRTIIVTDFAPDVCKDYKQTGFCGFGDGCKYLHAREDYKQGWQLDKEWEKVGNKDKANGSAAKVDNSLTEEERMLENIPFKCIICKEDYKTPIVTKCGHYFCERCAMQRYMKEKRRTCANCGADTGGSFGVAKKLKELLERKRKRLAENEAQEVASEVT